METLLAVGIALLAGLVMTRLIKRLHLPDVTAYLIAGVLIGPFCLGRLGINGLGFTSMENVESVGLIKDVALGFIAFSIGNEFKLSELKHIGKQAAVVGVVQALVAALMVDAALIGLHFILGDVFPISWAITLGAIATATAPAATMMVVKQYKAKGKLTDLLLPVVALDDAVGLIVFAVSFGIAQALEQGNFSVTAIAVEPLIEIFASLALGALLGVLMTYMQKWFHYRRRTSLTIALVFITVAITMLEFEIGGVHIGFSSLLVCMMMGTVFCNMSDACDEVMERVDRWTVPLNALFFVVSGAELELNVLTNPTVLLIGAVYIVFRCLGKYLGSYASCKATQCDERVTKNLGITLWPQAGVALGMCVTVAERMPVGGTEIRNIVLFAVLIYELVGPLLTKHALMRTGDISPENAKG